MVYGWGIDVGVASLGFAVIELDTSGKPASLVDGVSFVFPAPTGAAERTRYKSIRTQNKRRSARMRYLRARLIELFKIRKDFDTREPVLTDGHMANGKERRNNSRVRLRVHGLSNRLNEEDLARAIIHIAKNRGQRLTRGLKDEAQSDATKKKELEKERKTTADTANSTHSALAALGRKLGLKRGAHPAQLLMEQAGETGTTRLKKDRPDTPVFTRTQVQSELEALLSAQKTHHTLLTDDTRATLIESVFHEHDPKPPSIGKCRYGVTGADGTVETRLPRGTDLFQQKRIYEEVNNLRLISTTTAAETELTLSQRDHLTALLVDGTNLSAARVRKELGLGKGALADKTSLDVSEKGRKTGGEFKGHPLAAAMNQAGQLEQWRGFSADDREEVALLVRTEDEVDVLHLALTRLGIAPEAAKELSDARLPAAYSSAGVTATGKLLNELKGDVISNYEAEQRAGLKTTEITVPELDRLPYYGEILTGSCVGGSEDPDDQNEKRFGKIPNPVVHVALNQIRKVANRYLQLYGKPARVCIELARDLNKSAEDRGQIENEARKNRQQNEAYIEKIGAHKRKLGPKDILKLKLHGMQGGECLYTGASISVGQLFDGTAEVDHILPEAETYDSGISNLALALTEANQFKKKRPPFDAFNAGYKGQDYEHILKRAWKRGKGVYWRFKENAMDRYRDQDEFRARFLNDTRYIGKASARYLGSVCTDPNAVVCLNGRITSDLRYQWGLSSVIRDLMIADGRLAAKDVKRPKDGETKEQLSDRRNRIDKIRWDHRHHLLDAVVAACVTRADVQRLQTLAARSTEKLSAAELLAKVRRADPNFKNVGFCWQDDFRSNVTDFLQAGGRGHSGIAKPLTAVVHKADHDPRGQLHKETNYGVICGVPDQPGRYVAKSHAMIADLTKEQIENIGIPNTAIKAVGAAMKAGEPLWWGGPDPLSSLRDNMGKDLALLRDQLMKLMDKTPSEKLATVKTDKGRDKAQANWATSEYFRTTGRWRYTKVEVLSLRVLRGPDNHIKKPKRTPRPKRAYATKDNDRLIYFVNGDGERDWEIVSTLDANRPDFLERWRREDGRHLFTLRKDDLVEMLVAPKDPASARRIYRTVSFSPERTGVDVSFLPVEEARTLKDVPKKVRLRVRSLSDFRARMPAMVLLDGSGRVRWRGPSIN